MDPHMINYYKSEIKNPTRKVFMIDYKISNMLLNLIDGLISPLSTMLVEGITLGKPVLVFFPQEYDGKAFSADEIHFAEFIKIEDVVTVFKFEEFVGGIKKLSSKIGNKLISNRLKKKSEFFHVLDNKSYSEKLNDLTKKVYRDEYKNKKIKY